MLIKRKMSVNWLIFASPTLISSLYFKTIKTKNKIRYKDVIDRDGKTVLQHTRPPFYPLSVFCIQIVSVHFC